MSLSERVLGFLAENPGATVREIAECLGLSEVVVRRVLAGLKARGLVARAGRGYIATERGLRRIQGAPSQAGEARGTGEAQEGIAGGEEARESREEAKGAEAEQEARGDQGASAAGASPGVDVEALVRRVEELEARVKALEDALARLEGFVEELREALRGKLY